MIKENEVEIDENLDRNVISLGFSEIFFNEKIEVRLRDNEDIYS